MTMLSRLALAYERIAIAAQVVVDTREQSSVDPAVWRELSDALQELNGLEVSPRPSNAPWDARLPTPFR